MTPRVASWRCLAFLICFSCMHVSLSSNVSAQDQTASTGDYLLGTASTGGAYHPVGVALSTLIKLKLLPQFGVDLTAVNTDGSQENVDLIRNGDIQFAIISALAGHEARSGIGEFASVGPDNDLRAITTLWLSTDHLLIHKDAVKSGTINDFLELKNQPVSLGREGSSTLLENRTLMAALGVDIERDFDLRELSYRESAEALAAGQIEGMSVSGGLPIGAVQDLYETLGDDVAALEINDEQLASINGGRGLWQRAVIPSGTYPGQDREIYSIGTPNILAVSADVDDEVVYQITKTIFEELEYLHGLHNTTRQISLDNAVSNLPLPIHDGARRYFEEKGVSLPLPPMQLSQELLERYATVEEARTAAGQGVVSMFTGTAGDTSTQVASELAAVLSGEDDGVRLLATNGGGLGRNLTDLLYLKGVDTALVRADILNYARDQAVYPNIDNQVNYITEMFPEEVHLLAGSDVADLGGLSGKTINVGAAGSGVSITASVMLSQLGIRAEPTFFDPQVALEKLKNGEIAASFFVGGKPMPMLRQIDDESGLRLIALPAVDYFDSYRTSELSAADYPNLVDQGEVVPTMAVRTALLTYAWRPESQRYGDLGNFSNVLFENLLTLQADGYHPKWREVDPTLEFTGWRRFQPAALWVEDNEGTARRIASEGRVRLNEQQRAALANDAVTEPRPIDNPTEAEIVPPDVAAPADDVEPATPEVETAAPAPDVVPETDDATDAAVVPAAPVIELSPGLETSQEPAAVDEPSEANNMAEDSDEAEPQTLPQPTLPNVPSTGVKAPTF